MLRRGAHARALACAAALAVLAHAWALGLWPGPAPHALPAAAPSRAGTAAFEVRQIVLAPETRAPEHPAPAPALIAGAPQSQSQSQSQSQPQPQSESRKPVPAGRAPAAEAGAQESTANAAEDPAEMPMPMPAPPPTYRTSPPPALDLHYEVRRGEASGAARLTWRIDAEGRYALELMAVGVDGTPRNALPGSALAPHWTSHGTLDAAGIAPERFSVWRRGRERHAANFRRDAGIVSFAGPARTWPLVAGAQDRLSWMLQLASVLQADPALAASGSTVSMMVAGAHGDAGVWTFTVAGQAMVEGPDGEGMPAWHLRRESTHAHDPQVEVWLAPSLRHLPVRLQLTLPRGGASTEFRLRALQTP